jgi:Tfp pilus assembly protein PilO
MTQSASTQLRVAWLLVALTALLGFAAIVAPAERRLNAVESHALQLDELAARNEALLARLADLEQTRARVQGDLRRLSGKTSSGKVAVALLKVLEDEAARNHLTLSSLAPASVESPARGPAREEDVAVSLRGRYRDAMAAIADLPHHDVLVEVQSVSLARVASHQIFPSVDATVRVALYRDVADLAKEETHAPTAAQ